MPRDPRTAWEARKEIRYTDSGTGGTHRTVVDRETTLIYLSELAQEIDYLGLELNVSIGAALSAGMSWADVGEALDMHRQNCQRKWATARADYGFLEAIERDRLDRRLGVRAMRIVFEVRGARGDVLSRHHKIETALKARPGTEAVVKVYPGGKELVVG